MRWEVLVVWYSVLISVVLSSVVFLPGIMLSPSIDNVRPPEKRRSDGGAGAEEEDDVDDEPELGAGGAGGGCCASGVAGACGAAPGCEAGACEALG
jgi:hypothetical protein